MRLTRADNSVVADWWFTVDRALVAAVLGLIGVGIVLSFAASPAVAIRKGYGPFHFAERHLFYSLGGVALMLAVSLLPPRHIRRLALALLGLTLALMVWVLLTGPEINGAKRWLRLAGHSFQPSEVAKPAFVVLSAWLLAEGRQRRDMPAMPIAVGLLVAFAALLALQPDVGQALLVALVWGALFLISGQPLRWVLALALVCALGLAIAAWSLDHVRSRLARFLDPALGDTYQTDRAIQSFAEGGFLGRGPGEGTIKSSLPDAHTDFIFAVVGEEYGVLACLLLLALFALVAVRAFRRVWHEPDAFTRLAVAGLALLFCLQATINMGVNTGLLPAKGMTLPFISAGGSSTLAVSLTIGMLLALMRQRPDLPLQSGPARRSSTRQRGT